MKTDWYHQHQYNGHRHQSTRPQQPQAPNPTPTIVTPRMFNVCASSLLQTECASTMVTMPVHVLILMVVKHTQQWKQCLPCIQVQTTARCTPLAAAICATCFSPCLSANARVRCVRFTLMVLRKGSGAPPEARGVQGRRRRWCRMAHAANRFFVYGGFIFLPRHQHSPRRCIQRCRQHLQQQEQKQLQVVHHQQQREWLHHHQDDQALRATLWPCLSGQHGSCTQI